MLRRSIRPLLPTLRVGVSAVRYKYSKITPVLDLNYLLSPKNVEEISDNIKLRKGVGNIDQVHQLLTQENRDNAKLEELLLQIPNRTHPEVRGLGTEPRVLKYYNEKPEFSFPVHQFQEIAHKNKWFRMEHLGNFTGHKSYYLTGDLAALVGDQVAS